MELLLGTDLGERSRGPFLIQGDVVGAAGSGSEVEDFCGGDLSKEEEKKVFSLFYCAKFSALLDVKFVVLCEEKFLGHFAHLIFRELLLPISPSPPPFLATFLLLPPSPLFSTFIHSARSHLRS